MEKAGMTTDSRLEILPRFQVQVINRGIEAALITGTFSRVEGITVDARGWLFVSESESSIADVVTLQGQLAGLDVPNWSMTEHVRVGATLPWLDSRWQARDVAFLLDRAKEWQRVKYQATDAVVFAKKVLRCARCGWTGNPGAQLHVCPKCSNDLKDGEIFGNQEAAFPLDPDARFVETRSGFWDHEHCLICDVAIGSEALWGYREASFAGGPNSVGIWLCERCFDRYLKAGDFRFLVRSSADDESQNRGSSST
jgi:hypothetical protein